MPARIISSTHASLCFGDPPQCAKKIAAGFRLLGSDDPQKLAAEADQPEDEQEKTEWDDLKRWIDDSAKQFLLLTKVYALLIEQMRAWCSKMTSVPLRFKRNANAIVCGFRRLMHMVAKMTGVPP